MPLARAVSCCVLLGTLVFLGVLPVLRADGPRFVEEPAGVPMEGLAAPDFTLTALDGKSVTLSKLKGNVVFLDFWASWCGPCRKSIPHIQATYLKFKDRGLRVVGINVDKDKQAATRFLINLKPDYPLVLDPTARVMGLYEVQSMPTAYLVDKKGIVRKRIVGFSEAIGQETTREIESLLK